MFEHLLLILDNSYLFTWLCLLSTYLVMATSLRKTGQFGTLERALMKQTPGSLATPHSSATPSLIGHAPTHLPRLQEILQMCQSAVSPVHSGLLDGVFQGICSLMNFQF